jgi:hypothetical protein
MNAARTGALCTLAAYFALLTWVTGRYEHSDSLPWWVNALLITLLVLTAAFVAISIILARRDSRA